MKTVHESSRSEWRNLFTHETFEKAIVNERGLSLFGEHLDAVLVLHEKNSEKEKQIQKKDDRAVETPGV